MLEILTIEPITWITWTPKKPSDFPCMVCKQEIATQKLTCLLSKIVTLNLVVCHSCARLEAAEIMETIKE